METITKDTIKSVNVVAKADFDITEEVNTIKGRTAGNPQVHYDSAVGNMAFPEGVQTNLLNEDAPELLDVGGQPYMLWCREARETGELGTRLYESSYDGDAWSAPVAVTDDDFNSGVTAVVDSNGAIMAVWASASSEGLDYDTSSVSELMDAINEADMMYAVKDSGVWSTPQKIAAIANLDAKPSLAAGNDGEVVAVWLNSDDEEAAMSVKMSIWNGASWSTPATLDSGTLLDQPTIVYNGASYMIAWAKEDSGDVDEAAEWNVRYIRGTSGELAGASVGFLDTVLPVEDKFVVYDEDDKSWVGPIPISMPEECCEEGEGEDEGEIEGEGRPPRPPRPPDPPMPTEEDLDRQYEATSRMVRPRDPNEKVVLTGYGDYGLVDAGEWLEYIVYFENHDLDSCVQGLCC